MNPESFTNLITEFQTWPLFMKILFFTSTPILAWIAFRKEKDEKET